MGCPASVEKFSSCTTAHQAMLRLVGGHYDCNVPSYFNCVVTTDITIMYLMLIIHMIVSLTPFFWPPNLGFLLEESKYPWDYKKCLVLSGVFISEVDLYTFVAIGTKPVSIIL